MPSAVIEGPGTFYMGIIDILQEYNVAKRAERFLKAHVLMQNKNGISVAPPDRYAERFDARVVAAIVEAPAAQAAQAGAQAQAAGGADRPPR